VRYAIHRYHDISCGHRVVGHEGKCRNLHGHNYRIHFYCEPAEATVPLDNVGRVMDFGIVKLLLCSWLEDEWDHRMLLWESDADLTELQRLDKTVVALPFNPTAENLAAHLLNVVGPKVLDGSGVKLVAVNVEETRKCSAAATL